jgi:squalene-associated FAD-dependent desaturase
MNSRGDSAGGRLAAPAKVVVIGGGLAGISAALALRQAGCDVHLVEARQRLGGRVGSFDDPTSAQAIDYCQHVGMGCCTNLWQLLQQLEVAHLWQRQPQLHFMAEAGKPLVVRGLPLPAPLHLAGLLGTWPGLTWWERLRIARGLWAMMRLTSSAALADHRPVSAWLLEQYQTPNTIRSFWETILVSALGEQLPRLSLAATRKVLIDGFAIHRHAYHLLVPQRPLTELIDSQARSILEQAGIDLQLATPARGLCWRDGIVGGVQVADGRSLPADGVVVTAPWYRLEKLLGGKVGSGPALSELEPASRLGAGECPAEIQAWAAGLGRFQASPITGVHLWWDRPWLDRPHAILVGRLCQWVFPHPNPQPDSANEVYYQVVISGSRDLPRGNPSAVIQAVVADLEGVFPKLRSAKLLRSRLVTDPQAVFSLGPDEHELRPSVDRFARHRLFLAGDWTDTGWPATMEGAVRSGLMAAENFLQHWGEPRACLAKGLKPGILARCLIRP